MKKIAALTMLRDDNFFLKKWVTYYGGQLGMQNLYVFFDGLDQQVPAFCGGANTRVVAHIEGNRLEADRGRIDFLSERAAELFGKGYEIVIGTDLDEFVVVDPSVGKSLPEFLSALDKPWSSVSGLGIDVGQKLGEEEAISEDAPLLQQRHYALLNTRYSKANVLFSPVAWGSGFHRIRHGNFHIIKDLYLFHFGCVDYARIKARFSDRDLEQAGWQKHLERRTRTITMVSSLEARPWEGSVQWARRIQNNLRPIYAWNKPAMFGRKITVRIPDRFSKVI